MRLRETLSEALRNLAGGTSRAATMAFALASVVTALGVAEGAAVQRVLQEAAEFQASGASTMILSADTGINGVSCDLLSEVDGILAAGAVRRATDGFGLASLPSAPVPQWEATPGFQGVIGANLGQHDMLTGVLISETVAETTSTGPGGRLRTPHGQVDVLGVYPYPSDGRSTELEYAVISPVPDSAGPFDQCWAEVWPTDPQATLLLRLSLDASLSSDTRITVSQLNPTLGSEFDGPRQFAGRVTSQAPLAGLLVGLSLGYLSTRLRRLELASARHAGVPASSQALQSTAETMAWAAAAVLISAPVLWHQALTVDEQSRLIVLWLQLRVPLGGAIGAVSGALFGVMLTRERHLFRYFKER